MSYVSTSPSETAGPVHGQGRSGHDGDSHRIAGVAIAGVHRIFRKKPIHRKQQQPSSTMSVAERPRVE